MRHLGFLMLLGAAGYGVAQTTVIDGVTFASEPGALYVPIKSLGYTLGWAMRSEGKTFLVDDRPVTIPRVLPDGTRLIPITSLPHLGLTLDGEGQEIAVSGGTVPIVIRRAEKRVEINKAEQKLRAYQGGLLVIETHVSTGKKGHGTPSGTWNAGPEKSKLRFSRKYDNAPMPWAVQINGDVFMHGYRSVPKFPASHGCVRLPLRGINPAKFIWNWIDLGTPVTIGNAWTDANVDAKTPSLKGPETIPVKEPPVGG